MPEPIIVYEFEFGFHSGTVETYVAQQGRDTIAADDQRVRLEIHHDADTVEEIIVNRGQLAYMRTIQRRLQPETSVEDAGSIRLVHPEAVPV